MNIYQEHLLDHFHYPRNRGVMEHASSESGVFNPSCGDAIKMYIRVDKEQLIAIMFEGAGCVVSQAAASMLCEIANGKSIAEIRSFDAIFMKKLVGIDLGPTRLRCALLPLEALQLALELYEAGGSCYAR